MAASSSAADTLDTKGLEALRQCRFDEAVECFRRLGEIEPNSFRALYHLGCALNAVGKAREALNLLDRAIELYGPSSGVHTQRGMALLALDDLLEAFAAADDALRLSPDYFEAALLQAETLTAAGQLGDAERCLEVIRRINPSDVRVSVIAGEIKSRQGDQAAAARLAQSIKDVDPLFPAFLASQACIFADQGNTAHAVRMSFRALSTEPHNVYLIKVHAYTSVKHGYFSEAVRLYGHIVTLDESNAESWVNFGAALFDDKRFEDAVSACSRAIALREDYLPALCLRSLSLASLQKHKEALIDRERVMALDPDNARFRAEVLTSRAGACDWRDRDRLLELTAANLDAGGLVLEALMSITLYEDPVLHRQCAEIALSHTKAVAKQMRALRPLPKSGKIRLGYLSADLQLHPVGHLMAEVFARHDRSRFDVIAFSLRDAPLDPMQTHLRGVFDEFHNVEKLPDSELIRMIAEKDIEILVDLGGLTQYSRSHILAGRPAPVQVNFLGFPGTLGTDLADYIIGDPGVIPPGSEHLYAEQVVRLPYSYLPGGARALAEAGDRAAHGLPADDVVFCSFNPGFKITPNVFASWMRILAACPGSVLWLPHRDGVVENLRREAQAHGINPDRLVFAGRTSKMEEHVARLGLADIALDTAPYGSHTTAADALWAGVPLVTAAGPNFASRVAARLVTVAGAPELDRTATGDAEAFAIDLAQDPDRRAALRERLLATRASSPLFDARRFTRHLEDAFAEMSARLRRGLPPEGFDVPAS